MISARARVNAGARARTRQGSHIGCGAAYLSEQREEGEVTKSAHAKVAASLRHTYGSNIAVFASFA